MTKPSLTALDAARWLMIVLLIAVLFSPPVVNLAQALLLLLFVFSAELRGRIVQACRQPMVIGVLAFYLVISIGVLYSIADSHDALKMWGGWRKLLLLPLAVALFDEAPWKLRLAHALIGVSVICAVASYYGVLAQFHFPAVPGIELGVVIRNHSTQGMVFGVAAFAAASLALFRRDMAPKMRLLLIACAGLLASNIILVTTGRSGYVVLVVCSVSLIAGLLLSGRRITIKFIGIAAVALAILVSSLALAPSSRMHIMQAIGEAQGYRQATSETSMGIRVIFWKNTITLIAKRPIFGYGTGAFYTAYKDHVASLSGLNALVTGDPHNQFMKIAGEHGLAGLAVFLAFLISALRQRPSMPYRLLGLGVLAAWCTTSLANSHFSTFNEGVFIYVWLGAMLAEERERA